MTHGFSRLIIPRVLIGRLAPLIVVALVFWREGAAQGELPKQNPTGDSASTAALPESPDKPITSKEQAARSAFNEALSRMQEEARKAGLLDERSLAERLRDAVGAGDEGETMRAFNDAIYGRTGAPMSEVIAALKVYLAHPTPFVRLMAAESLYTAGDRSGHGPLIRMVTAVEPILDGDSDLRLAAAGILAKFRERKALPSILQLDGRVPKNTLLDVLTTLGAKEAAIRLEEEGFHDSESLIRQYGILGLRSFIPELTALCRDGISDSTAKVAAAWALARFGQESYATLLAEMAQPAIDANPQPSVETTDAHSEALKYLGSLQAPLARQVLEHALDSKNDVAVKYAVVNLLFNQRGGSEKARKFLLQELRDGPKRLGHELAFNLAAKLDDPEVRAVGEKLDRDSPLLRPWRYAVERKKWPIYNWINDYVVDLDETLGTPR